MKNTPSMRVLVLAFALIAAPRGQAGGPLLDEAGRNAILMKAAQIVDANYVDLDKARAVRQALVANAAAGKYGALSDTGAFLAALNEDMQRAAADRHLKIVENPRIVAQLRSGPSGEAAPAPEYLRMLRENNFRLRRVESLDGNVGYFRFDNFVELPIVRTAFVGAMDFLGASSALILDLRENGGGASETADLLVSYFLPDGTRTAEVWSRATGETTVATVRRAPDVRPLPNVPLFVLVSERTASAAEAVAYTLQQARRATVVGSRTKGLANPGLRFVVDDRLFIIVPTFRQKNVASGTSWEGVGVSPDVRVPPGSALDAAMDAALRALAGRQTDEKKRRELMFRAEAYAARLSPTPLPASLIEASLGDYEGGRRIARDCESLEFVQADSRRRLLYLGDRTFAVEGRTDYRLRLSFDGERVGRLEVLWSDGTTDSFPKVPHSATTAPQAGGELRRLGPARTGA